jgi:hypothetical protein
MCARTALFYLYRPSIGITAESVGKRPSDIDKPFDRPFERLTLLSRVEGLFKRLTALSETEGGFTLILLNSRRASLRNWFKRASQYGLGETLKARDRERQSSFPSSTDLGGRARASSRRIHAL